MKTEKVMAFDVGSKKTGVAVGERLIGSARPLRIIYCPVDTLDVDHLADLIKEWQPQSLLFGMPQHADGTAHPLSKNIRRVAEKCQETFQLEIHYVDETLTSHEARKRQKNKKADVDAIAAAIMLEDWFASVLR